MARGPAVPGARGDEVALGATPSFSAHPLLRADWLPRGYTAQAVPARGRHQACAPSKAIVPGPTTTATPSRRCGGSGSSRTTAFPFAARLRLASAIAPVGISFAFGLLAVPATPPV